MEKVLPESVKYELRKANESKPAEDASRMTFTDVKTESADRLGTSLGGTCLLPRRHPAYRRREPSSGVNVERGKLRPRHRAGGGRWLNLEQEGDLESAGINRQGVADERAVRRRNSEPLRPGVIRCQPRGWGRSVDTGTCRLCIQLRNPFCLGCRCCEVKQKATFGASSSRDALGPHGVEDHMHARKRLAREPGNLRSPSQRWCCGAQREA